MFRKQLHSSKWAGKTDVDAYALTLADMDFPLYEPFKQKLIEAIHNLNNLTYKDRSSQYFKTLINLYRQNHQAYLSRTDFVECPSICNLIGCSIIAFTQEKQNVLIFTPVYSFYINSIKSLKRQLVICQLKQIPFADNQQKDSYLFRYEFDAKNFQNKMNQHKPKLIILCNPHNPSGKIFKKIQLDLIVKKAEQLGTYILSDEIMGDFTLFPVKNSLRLKNLLNINQNKSIISLSTYQYPKIIIGNSISKVFNCESVQGGYGIIKCQQVRNAYKTIANKGFKLLTNQMSLILTPIVYSKQGVDWITFINKVIDANYSLFVNTFKAQKILKIFELESSYLTTIEFEIQKNGYYPITNQQLASLLASFGLFFIDMQDYYYPPTDRNIFRISIAIDNNQFEKFVNKFKDFIEYFKQRLIKTKTQKQSEINKMSKL